MKRLPIIGSATGCALAVLLIVGAAAWQTPASADAPDHRAQVPPTPVGATPTFTPTPCPGPPIIDFLPVGATNDASVAVIMHLQMENVEPGIIVRLEKAGTVIAANTTVLNQNEVIAAFHLLGADPGAYGVTAAYGSCRGSAAARPFQIEEPAPPVESPPAETRLPLIFIPGIAGSELIRDGTKIWLDPFGSSDRAMLSLVVSPPRTVIAPDVLRLFAYNSLLKRLTGEGHYVEYLVDGDPARRTQAGCDMRQGAARPTLFVFAYDWRVDNAINAAALRDYVLCVRRFHPDSQINLLTHSMGSLLARRYILDNAPDHYVNDMITIGAPWLGATKLLHVLETGEFITEPFLIAAGPGIKAAAQTMTAAHQLMPGRAFFELYENTPPFVENGWDINTSGNGEAPEAYDFDTLRDLADMRYLNAPATTADDFHTYGTAAGDQDDWRMGNSGIDYYHIYGVQTIASTILQMNAVGIMFCDDPDNSLSCREVRWFAPKFGVGDGTVPARSASRRWQTLDLNAPGAEVLRFYGLSAGGDDDVEHTGLTENPQVQRKVLEILAQEESVSSRNRLSDPPAEEALPVLPAHYLTTIGVSRVTVVDADGNSSAPVEGDLLGTVPGVTSLTFGPDAAITVLPVFGVYTVTFQTTGQPLAIELTTGDGETTTRAIRYMDLSLPPGLHGSLSFSITEISSLRVDEDGDGVHERAIPATVDVGGSQAQDTVAPVVALSAASLDPHQVQVTIVASDAASGVASVRYSLDGQRFNLYQTPFIIDPTQTPFVYAFADDQVRNRSSLTQLRVGYSIYIPTVQR